MSRNWELKRVSEWFELLDPGGSRVWGVTNREWMAPMVPSCQGHGGVVRFRWTSTLHLHSTSTLLRGVTLLYIGSVSNGRLSHRSVVSSAQETETTKHKAARMSLITVNHSRSTLFSSYIH
jgi:hypothetical protein